MDNEASIGEESAEETKGSDTEENKRSLSIDDTKVKSLPASVRKLYKISIESDNNSGEEYSKGPEGFRLVDISVLSAVFHLLCCPVCKHGRVEFAGRQRRQDGFRFPFFIDLQEPKVQVL